MKIKFKSELTFVELNYEISEQFIDSLKRKLGIPIVSKYWDIVEYDLQSFYNDSCKYYANNHNPMVNITEPGRLRWVATDVFNCIMVYVLDYAYRVDIDVGYHLNDLTRVKYDHRAFLRRDKDYQI